MNRFFKVLAVAAAGVALACLGPAQAWAACPGGVPVAQCTSSGGGVTFSGTQVGGTFWMVGQGNDLVGPGDTTPGFGNDAGALAGLFTPPLDAGTAFVTDFGGGVPPGSICVTFGWDAFGIDGCGDGLSGVMAVAMRDNAGNFAIMQVGPSGATSYDFDLITNGGTGPNGGTGNGVPLQKAVSVTGSSDLGSTVDVTVAPLNLGAGVAMFDDLGGARPLPGAVRLIQRAGGVDTLKSSGAGGGTVNVAADSEVCWELVDGLYHVLLGCRTIGGNTPSQNVVNGKAGFAKGGAAFTWDVTAQFDVLGFNIYQKNTSKNTDRQVNDALIPLSGDNDATAESYNYVAPRSDLRAWKGGFEIELVRQNGETSRAPVTIAK